MASVSSISTISKVFSKLGDNSGSVIPMFAKDMTSSGLTSYTYFKDGGKMDGAEKALEEFGTTVIWLGGIPLVKHLFDKTLYKKAGLSPDIAPKKLFANAKSAATDTLEYAKDKAQSLGAEYKEQAEILENTIKNKSLAKKLSIGKFAISTAAIGLALYGLITLKQKRTEKKVEENIREKLAKDAVLKNSLSENGLYNSFNGKKDKSLSFKGLGSIGTFFMSNPVANTAIVDGVITSTRLTQARKGEKFEVGLREFCQLLFIYGLAQPLQKGLEFVGKNVFKKPINLDYATLDSAVLKEAIEQEAVSSGSSSLLKQAKEIIKLGKDEKSGGEKIIDFIFKSENKDIQDILKRNKSMGVFKTKEGAEQLSLLSQISPNKIKGTAQKTADIIENAAKSGDISKYLKQTKLLKGAAIVANILISAVLMGYLQPKLNLFIRKKLNDGDNTNPAIRHLENKLQQKIMFEGKDNQTQKN